jgi:hypothetical protein
MSRAVQLLQNKKVDSRIMGDGGAEINGAPSPLLLIYPMVVSHRGTGGGTQRSPDGGTPFMTQEW